MIVSLVHATTPEDLNSYALYYYELEESNFNYIDNVGNSNLVSGVAPIRAVGGIIGYTQDFENTNNHVLATANSENNELTRPFGSFWATFESCSNNGLVGSYYYDTSEGNKRYGYMIRVADASCPSNILIQIGVGNITHYGWESTETVTTNALYHIAYYYDGSDMRVWINNTEATMTPTVGATSRVITYKAGTVTKFIVGTYERPTGFYTTSDHDGTIDEIYQANLNGYGGDVTDLVDYLYNSGAPDVDQQYEFPENTAPTNPTALTLTNPIYVNNTLTATASGSTDAENNSITYYYTFYNINSSTTLQAESTDNTYIIALTDAHDLIRVRARAFDSVLYSISYKETNRAVSNSAPTTPTNYSINASYYYIDNITTSVSGSTDPDNDLITYYYEWTNVNDSIIRQNLSIINWFQPNISDINDVLMIRARAYDTLNYSDFLNYTSFILDYESSINISNNATTTIKIIDIEHNPIANATLVSNIIGNSSINSSSYFASDTNGMLLFPYNSNYTYRWVFSKEEYDTLIMDNLTIIYSYYEIQLTQEGLTMENIYITIGMLAFAMFMAFIALFMTQNRTIRILAGVTLFITGVVFYPISVGLMIILILFGLFISVSGVADGY
jgi:hypothetical protein